MLNFPFSLSAFTFTQLSLLSNSTDLQSAMSSNNGKAEGMKSSPTTSQPSSSLLSSLEVREPYEVISPSSEYATKFGTDINSEAERREELLLNSIRRLEFEMERMKKENQEYRTAIEGNLTNIQVKIEANQEEKRGQLTSTNLISTGSGGNGESKPKVGANGMDRGAGGNHLDSGCPPLSPVRSESVGNAYGGMSHSNVAVTNTSSPVDHCQRR